MASAPMLPEATLPGFCHTLALAYLSKARLHRIPEPLLDNTKIWNLFYDPQVWWVEP